jgi:LmbE family N-acetylglucosaminyl deacetylase
MKNKTVLAVGAHPDDVEIFGAGTLALLRQKGWNIVIATMTAGDVGSATLSRDEISEIRLQEAKAAARILNADYHCMYNEDIFLEYNRPTLLKAVKLIREVKPNIVFTMSPQDYMIDHEITSQIVRTACFSAGIPLIKTDDISVHDHIPHLYYYDPMECKDIFGKRISASLVIDITSVMMLKEEMLKCHESQRKWLKKHHGLDEYIIAMNRFSKIRGKENGVKYAEGLRQHLGHPYPQKNILKEELGKLVHIV